MYVYMYLVIHIIYTVIKKDLFLQSAFIVRVYSTVSLCLFFFQMLFV